MRFAKDPSANKDYGFDYHLWMSSGDTISTSTWSASTATGSASTCSITSQSITSHTTVCFVGSGTLGSNDKITNRIVTAQGRTEEKSFDLQIINL